MNNVIKLFENPEFGKVRTVLHNNEPYFVGKDIAEVLGYARPRDAIRKYCKGGAETTLPTNGGMQSIIIIPERDVYRLVMRSKKPEAEKFENWVVSEVLPQIRKTGGYIPIHDQMNENEILSRAFLIANKTIEQQKLKLKRQQHLVEFANHVTNSSNALDMGQFAKVVYEENIPLGRNKLFKWLRDKKYLMRNNVPYQKYIDNGYFKVIEVTYETPYGLQVDTKTLVSGKGQIKILEKLKSKNLNTK